VRIAHVSDCFAPRMGGIETQVAALAAQQAAAGDDVRIITATPGHGDVFSGDDVVDGLPVHRTAAHLPFELPVHPRTGREVARVLAEHAVDVVHVHAGVISPYAWGAIRAARKAGIPTLVTVHSIWGPMAAPGFAAANTLLRWSQWGATLSAVSDVAAGRIASAVPAAGEVLVVPNGIDPSLWQVAHMPAGATALRLASVLRMAPRKRTMSLVKIIESAIHRLDGVTVTAVLVGDGPERSRAERYARDRGLAEAIEFPGRLPRQRILDVFARTDVYIQPSVKESFGLAALEARTAGLPIVARVQTGTTQFVHDEVEGLLAADDRGMADAVVRLGRDRRLLDAIARHNTSIEPDQSWPTVLRIVRTAYDRAGATER
jgi:glycosyltransferase involved in cell wall biosynthesis